MRIDTEAKKGQVESTVGAQLLPQRRFVVMGCRVEIVAIRRHAVHLAGRYAHMIEKGGFDHFMLKEIHEQPSTLRNAIRGRLKFDEGIPVLNGLNLQYDQLRQIKRIVITACGTSWHAGLIAEYMIEELARLPVEVEYASEFRYRLPIFDKDTNEQSSCQKNLSK